MTAPSFICPPSLTSSSFFIVIVFVLSFLFIFYDSPSHNKIHQLQAVRFVMRFFIKSLEITKRSFMHFCFHVFLSFCFLNQNFENNFEMLILENTELNLAVV